MSVVKFEATVENGSIIIPTEFRNRVKGKVEVSVRLKNKSNAKEEPYDIISELIKNPSNHCIHFREFQMLKSSP